MTSVVSRPDLRYRCDALCVHISEMRKLFPGVTLGAGFQCQECGRVAQQIFLHPAERFRWACMRCMQFEQGYRSEGVIRALARERDQMMQSVFRLRDAHQETMPAPPTLEPDYDPVPPPARAKKRRQKLDEGAL